MAKKKETPMTCVCRKCGKTPVIVKIRAGIWRVACPYLGCKNFDSSLGSTETEAIEAWNDINAKEAQKK